MQLVHVTISVPRALLQNEGLDRLRALIEQEVRADVAARHHGYAVDTLRCLGMYHWPHPEHADRELAAAAYLYTLIRAPLSV